MRRIMQFVAIAAAVTAASALTAANASALSLGPTGTKITTPLVYNSQTPAGMLGVNDNYGLQFGTSVAIRCQYQNHYQSGVDLSGTLNGSASVTLNATFKACYNGLRPDPKVIGGRAAATVSAPGGIVLTLTSRYSASTAEHPIYNGTVAVGPGGLQVTTPTDYGTCTLSVPAGTRLEQDTGVPVIVYSTSFSLGASPKVPGAKPFTGTSGCGPELSGSHSSFKGQGWFQKLDGLKLSG